MARFSTRLLRAAKPSVAISCCILSSMMGCAAGGAPGLSDGRGAVFVVGGGGTPGDVIASAIAFAGGSGCRVVIVPQASLRDRAGEDSATMFRDAGARDVKVLQLGSAGAADPSMNVDAAALLNQADLIWMSGGDQNRLMRRLVAAGVVETIRERHRAGAVVGGTSAGAAVASALMLTGEAKLDAVERSATELADGLGLWRGVIVDQHFHRRRRFNRLLSAVLDHPECVGVGIDERTAVVVRGQVCEVMGESSVIVIDARRAVIDHDHAGGLADASNVRIDVIAPGGRFTIDDALQRR